MEHSAVYEAKSSQVPTSVRLKDVNTPRYGAGIFYDCHRNRIYLGGGCQFSLALRSIECYDLHKNSKWNQSLAYTNMKHDYYPIIWNDLNRNLLYIASVCSNSIESIDIRTNSKQWNVVYGPKEKHDSLEALFETEFDSRNIQTSRLLI